MSDIFFVICLLESTRDCDMEIGGKNGYRCFFTAFYQSENIKFHFRLGQKPRVSDVKTRTQGDISF